MLFWGNSLYYNDQRLDHPIINDVIRVVDLTTGEVLWQGHNTITDVLRQRVATWFQGGAVTVPSYIALGNGIMDTNETESALTSMEAEYARQAIDIQSLQASDVARISVAYLAKTGTGIVNELGLFDSAASTATVDACDATTGWSAAVGAITLDNSDYKEGTGSLLNTISSGTGTGAFTKSTLTPALISGANDEDTDFLQMWYQIDDVSDLSAAVVRIGSDSSNYYEWNVFADLVDGWNFLSLEFSEATQTGTPDIDAMDYFTFRSTNTGNCTQNLDAIRLFRPAGNMFAHAELSTPIDKGIYQVLAIYWYIAVREGSPIMATVPFAKEELSISSTATPLTSSVYSPGGSEPASVALITVETSDIRWWSNGSTPTDSGGTASGHVTVAGGVINLDSAGAISNFKAIAKTNGQTAALKITFSR